ncbi:tenascin-R-like, partial [Passerculus sandwichensis]
VFQRRQDGSTDFWRDWDSYANGFGNVSGEFWLGNEALHELTRAGPSELRVELRSGRDVAFAAYRDFSVGSAAERYRLRVGAFRGTAGGFGGFWESSLSERCRLRVGAFTGTAASERCRLRVGAFTGTASEERGAMGSAAERYRLRVGAFTGTAERSQLRVGAFTGTAGDALSYHSGSPFSTRDRDPRDPRDRRDPSGRPRPPPCAVAYGGAWWYRNCHYANLNGRYGATTDHQGVHWFPWRGFNVSIAFTEMKLRPQRP